MSNICPGDSLTTCCGCDFLLFHHNLYLKSFPLLTFPYGHRTVSKLRTSTTNNYLATYHENILKALYLLMIPGYTNQQSK